MASAADEQGALAFQDDFTTSHGGLCYFVSVEPVFQDQIAELVNMIARSRPENVRVSYISQFVAAAKHAAPAVGDDEGAAAADEEEEDESNVEKKEPEETEEIREAKRKVIRDLMSSIKQLRLEGADKEFEGFVNLLLSLILSLFPASHPDFNQLIVMLSDAVSFSADRTVQPSLASRYASLATIFNSLPSSNVNALRLNVLLKLISYAANNDDFAVITPALDRFESYLIEWGFGPGSHGEEEGNAAVSTVVAALVGKSKLADARNVLVAHLSAPSAVSGSSASPSASAQKLASQLIALSLRLPTLFDFSSLASIPAVANPSVPALAKLLSIFQSGDVAAFESFAQDSSNAQVLSEHSLDAEALSTKLKLLALAELCSTKVGENVSYDEIAQALRLKQKDDDGEEVETWVIDAIRASLISGRLSQSLLSFHVTRAAPRTFTTNHWSQLATRLSGWRTSLDGILDSVGKGLQQSSSSSSGHAGGREGHGRGAVELMNNGSSGAGGRDKKKNQEEEEERGIEDEQPQSQSQQQGQEVSVA